MKKSKKRKHKSDEKHRKKKRKRVSSSSSSSSTSSSSSSSSDSIEKRKNHKRKHKKSKDVVDKKKVKQIEKPQSSSESDCGVPLDLFKGSSTMRPETKEEYETRQSQIRRVVDPETGRSRLIKGDGEIIEEIVSRERHLEINKKATATDGQMFQINTVGPSVRK